MNEENEEPTLLDSKKGRILHQQQRVQTDVDKVLRVKKMVNHALILVISGPKKLIEIMKMLIQGCGSIVVYLELKFLKGNFLL